MVSGVLSGDTILVHGTYVGLRVYNAGDANGKSNASDVGTGRFYKGYVVVLTEEGEERLKPLNRGRWYRRFDRILKRI